MKIAVLGWGSLIWDPKNLQIKGSWNKDGPLLPIEFARISRNGRLTLVLYLGADNLPTLWAHSAYEDLNLARQNLREREGTSLERIGYISVADNQNHCHTVPEVCDIIRQWADKKGIEAVVWTDLSSNFENKTGITLNAENVIAYLRGLTSESLEKAEEYVRKTPTQVRTAMRRRIERELGWVCIQVIPATESERQRPPVGAKRR